MKKNLLLLLALVAPFAIAVTYPVAGVGLLANYMGAWESTTQYTVTVIQGTNKSVVAHSTVANPNSFYLSAPMVTDGGATYIMTNESAAHVGKHPASEAVTWKAI